MRKPQSRFVLASRDTPLSPSHLQGLAMKRTAEGLRISTLKKTFFSTLLTGSVAVGAILLGSLDSSVSAEEKQAAQDTILLSNTGIVQGIAGKGPLKLEEIKTWLADPANHRVLKVELPLGLNVGKIPEGVLEANPITRAKVELGRQLYFDTRLSIDNTVSCGTCHHPDTGWAAPTQFGEGIQGLTGNRNSPTSYNRILSTTQFWDGRAGSLEEQAVGPIENPIEMGNTHANAVKTLQQIPGYVAQFKAVFGTDKITIEDVGRALATFERVIATGPAPFDYYERTKAFKDITEEDLEDDPDLKTIYDQVMADYKANAMSESAVRGRDLFFSERINCAACHVGANLTDELYHNLGVGMDQKEPDLGRFVVTGVEKDKGAFKTPTIRNIAQTGPYMHDGSQKTLLEVVEHYNKGGTPNPYLSDKVFKLNLTEQEKLDLVAFMEACTGDTEYVETERLPE